MTKIESIYAQAKPRAPQIDAIVLWKRFQSKYFCRSRSERWRNFLLAQFRQNVPRLSPTDFNNQLFMTYFLLLFMSHSQMRGLRKDIW